MHHQGEKEHIFFHLLKKRLLACCNFFLSDHPILCHKRYDWYKVLERRGRSKLQGLETIKHRTRRGTAAWESNHKRVSSYQCLNLQNRPDSLQGPQPYGEIHTPCCTHCVHKSAVNCHSENEFSETGFGHDEDFSSSKLFQLSLTWEMSTQRRWLSESWKLC